MNDILAKLIFLAGLVLLTSSCGSVKDLEEHNYALVKNTFIVHSNDSRVNKSKIISEIKGLIKQSPVKKNVLNPRTWGTPLTIYKGEETQESMDAFVQFLINRKGFYHASANFRERIDGKKVEVVYEIDLGNRYYISDIEYQGKDTSLMRLFQADPEERIINPGDPLDSRIFDEEENRLVTIAKNNGYADFNGNFIEFRGDSSSTDVPVKIFVYSPLDQDTHQKFEIGNINIYTEHFQSEDPKIERTEIIQNHAYHAKGVEFIVDPSWLEDVISLEKGETYSRKKEYLTNRKLSSLSPYRFVNIKPKIQEDRNGIYDLDIFLTPHEHKWVFDMGANFFYSLLSQAPSVSQRDLFGVAGNIGWENRNFRKRAISHRFGVEGTFEFQIPTFTPNTFSIQANNSFEIPKVVDPLKMANFFKFTRLLTDQSFQNLNQFTNTEVDFSLGITDILNAYSLNTLSASWSFKFQPDDYNRYIYTQIGINVLETQIDSIFQAEILNNNALIELSFRDYLFTGFVIRELNVFKQTRESQGGNYFAYLGSLEFSGVENWVLNKLVNGLTSFNDRWTLGGVGLSQFIRFDNDIRFYQKVRERSSFAARFNVGIGIPFGGDPVLPFVKSFFVGGPNSLRGWQLRELGPGAYSDRIIEPIQGQPFFQTGDFKLEMNLEYRYDLFWFWEGAFFMDIGNVWTLKSDPARVGSKLTKDFLDQMAMSVGWGLRADFDYFILRLDFGYKLRNPFPDPQTNSHIVLTNGAYNGILGNVNFAINYPF